jgi:hypothetical protein
MKNKLHLLILLTPLLLFVVVSLLGNRDSAPVNTSKLQAILARANYATLFDSKGDAETTLEEQTIYRGKNVREFATRFRLSDTKVNKNMALDLGPAYNCWFSLMQKNGSVAANRFYKRSF